MRIHRLALAGMLLLSGCAQVMDGKSVGNITFDMINNYAMIERDFERGRVMRARERVLVMKPGEQDYQKAQAFLKQKIEPARRRIFVHFLRTARDLERKQLWSEAAWAYDQAKSVTVKPEAMEAKRVEMELKMRQVRMNALDRQRQAEDKALLEGLAAYNPPKGVASDDEVYLRKREQYVDKLDERADFAYVEGRRFLRRGHPEIAWVEVQSQLRLQPGSPRGVKLLDEVMQAMPKGLSPPRQHDEVAKRTPHLRMPRPEAVSEKAVKDALKQGDLLEARQLALAYRRADGKGAEALLAQVRGKLAARAKQRFDEGSRAFRSEDLDRAIASWSEAVQLMPEESEYVGALHRARQLKERLNLLRSQQENEPVLEENSNEVVE